MAKPISNPWRKSRLFAETSNAARSVVIVVPILVPIEQEDVSIIIGRAGFFDQFKITFIEAEKKIEFKKFGAGQIRY